MPQKTDSVHFAGVFGGAAVLPDGSQRCGGAERNLGSDEIL